MSTIPVPPYLLPILLLLGSNIFMTVAWYWYLRFKELAFSVLYLMEPLGWNYGVGFALIAAGAFFVFHKW
jgi:uncharacterized protein